MKKVILVLSVTCFCLSSCMVSVVSGTGSQVSDDRSVSSFNGVDISGALDATINVQDGATPSVQLNGYGNMLKYIKTEVKGGVLNIYTAEGIQLNTDQKIKATITLPALSSLSLSGATDAVIYGNVKGNDLALEVSGKANIVADNISVSNFSTEISGAAKVKISGGSTQAAKYELSGASVLNAFDLVTDETSIDMSGTGVANINAQKKLDADISGVGGIHYKGHPAITSDRSGIGTLTDAN